MFDIPVSELAAGFAAMTTVYWICLIVGGGLLLISTVMGGHGHADAHGDVSMDSGMDAHTDAVHGHAGSLAGWFSIRFVVFFLAVFGMIGVALSLLTKLGGAAVLASALGGGLLVGQCVHQLMRSLHRNSGDSTTQPGDYVNKLGRVTIRIEPPQKGEVAVQIAQGERFLPALSRRADRAFRVGEQVAVVAYRGGIAEVVSREEFEFLKNGA
jgi:membrane protein implicated in regulation of membrane protease activity